MKVAWLSHQFASETPLPARPGLLPGIYAGGAERSTEEMLAQAPDRVEVTRFRLPGGFGDLSGFDRVVVGATEALGPHAVKALVRYRPVLWVRSVQDVRFARLFEAARLVVWPSHQIVKHHPWFSGPYEVCPAPLDPAEVPRGVAKEDFALWAGRDHPQKGEAQARAWAIEEGVRFVAMKNAPRPEVLEAMGRARWFVHLPQSPDPCPRTVIEAEIAGCDIVTNDLCGRVPVQGADNVAEFVSGSAERFWTWTLNAS